MMSFLLCLLEISLAMFRRGEFTGCLLLKTRAAKNSGPSHRGACLTGHIVSLN